MKKSLTVIDNQAFCSGVPGGTRTIIFNFI